MGKNRIKLVRGSRIVIPLFHEIREKKAELTLSIFEKGEQKRKLSAGEIHEWLVAEESMQYPLEGRRYTLYYRNETVFFVCNEDADAEVEYSVKWNDPVISVKGGVEGTFPTREEEPKAKSLQKSGNETVLEQKLQEERSKNETFQTIIMNYMLQSFHESGAYVEKLAEVEASLKDSDGKAAYQEWKKRKEALDAEMAAQEEKQKQLEQELQGMEAALSEKQDEIRRLEKRYEEAGKGLKQMELLNEETLKKLEENNERLKMDREVLQFIETHNLDVEKTLKNVEDTLKETEKMVREAIILKEKKIDTIEKSVRGDNGAES